MLEDSPARGTLACDEYGDRLVQQGLYTCAKVPRLHAGGTPAPQFPANEESVSKPTPRVGAAHFSVRKTKI